MHLVYSPDDAGWYWERFIDWATSQLFPSATAACEAKHYDQLIWS